MYKKLARKITNHCIDNPIITICFALFITALAFSGIRHVKQDDNMVNLLPEDIGSRVIFEEIQDNSDLGPVLSWNPNTGSLQLTQAATQRLFASLGGRLTSRGESGLIIFFPIAEVKY